MGALLSICFKGGADETNVNYHKKRKGGRPPPNQPQRKPEPPREKRKPPNLQPVPENSVERRPSWKNKPPSSPGYGDPKSPPMRSPQDCEAAHKKRLSFRTKSAQDSVRSQSDSKRESYRKSRSLTMSGSRRN